MEIVPLCQEKLQERMLHGRVGDEDHEVSHPMMPAAKREPEIKLPVPLQ